MRRAPSRWRWAEEKHAVAGEVSTFRGQLQIASGLKIQITTLGFAIHSLATVAFIGNGLFFRFTRPLENIQDLSAVASWVRRFLSGIDCAGIGSFAGRRFGHRFLSRRFAAFRIGFTASRRRSVRVWSR